MLRESRREKFILKRLEKDGKPSGSGRGGGGKPRRRGGRR